MTTPNWRTDIRLDDLPDSARELADIIGLDALISLVTQCGGLQLYIPRLESIEIEARNRYIARSLNGVNAARIARETGLTASAVRRIAKEYRRRR